MPRRVVRPNPPEALAEDGALRAGIATLRAEMAVDRDFPDDVLAEAERAAAEPVLPAEDRTDLPFVTVDPPGAQDLDQALHIERRGDGFRVHYAIADVAAFVRPGGAIDLEAHRRGETLYDVGDKVPLHPPAISERACSLLPDGPRPALLWSIDVDATGEGTAVDVRRAMVRSRGRYDYAQVQRDLDAGTAPESFVLLREVGLLREARERARGGVSLPLPDQEVVREGGHWRLTFRRQLPVEGWNAQISLLTGMAAAHLMVEGRVGLLRTLAPADTRDVARLRRVAAALDVPWAEGETYPDFIRRLDAGQPAHAAVLNSSTALLRGSGYVAFDGEVPERAEHSALASTYSHVTAPLRRLIDRYAGEICVALSAGAEVPAWVRERLEGLPATMQESARRANAYERSVFDLVEAAVLADQVGQSFEVAVVQVDERDPASGQVVVRDPAVEARARRVSGEPLPLGETVTATLAEADPVVRRVRFDVA